MKNLITNEPVLTAVGGLLSAFVLVLVAFGVDLTTAQIEALSALGIAALGVAKAVRDNVTPTRKTPAHKRA